MPLQVLADGSASHASRLVSCGGSAASARDSEQAGVVPLSQMPEAMSYDVLYVHREFHSDAPRELIPGIEIIKSLDSKLGQARSVACWIAFV